MPKSKTHIQEVTDWGQPFWTYPKPINTHPPLPLLRKPNDIAEVYEYLAPHTIFVDTPDQYTPPVAAHEATHVFQNTRNHDFQNRSEGYIPNYDYGGLEGLRDNPRRSIGQYTDEQQADMVRDLTYRQAQLHPRMTKEELEEWDRAKQTLERPIRELMAIPPPDTSIRGLTSSLLEAMRLGALLPPTMSTSPLPNPPEAPSSVLGYANPSDLVRNVNVGKLIGPKAYQHQEKSHILRNAPPHAYGTVKYGEDTYYVDKDGNNLGIVPSSPPAKFDKKDIVPEP